MSYNRVIPRDLFNEASLLKCLGQVYLNLENSPWGFRDETLTGAQLVGISLERGFLIDQDLTSGSIYPANVRLVIHRKRATRVLELYRPLNSRRPYPLYLLKGPDAELEVLQDDGEFTPEMRTFLKEILS